MQLYCCQLLDMIKRVVVYKVVGEIQLKHLYLVYHISRIPRKLYKHTWGLYWIQGRVQYQVKSTLLIQKGRGVSWFLPFNPGNSCQQTVYAGHRSHKKYLGVSKVNFVNLLGKAKEKTKVFFQRYLVIKHVQASINKIMLFQRVFLFYFVIFYL